MQALRENRRAIKAQCWALCSSGEKACFALSWKLPYRTLQESSLQFKSPCPLLSPHPRDGSSLELGLAALAFVAWLFSMSTNSFSRSFEFQGPSDNVPSTILPQSPISGPLDHCKVIVFRFGGKKMIPLKGLWFIHFKSKWIWVH